MITKQIFREEVKQLLLEQMAQGNIEPGERISLPGLAKEIDVSVTPIREALTQLTESGLITYIANRGFFVTKLTKTEAEDIYEAIAILEGEAIKKSNFSEKQLNELLQINEKFIVEQNAMKRLKLDMNFHQKLTEQFKNQFIIKTIEDIRIRLFIYEHKFMQTESLEASYAMHNSIINYLKVGAINDAIKILISNWELSIHHILSHYNSKM